MSSLFPFLNFYHIVFWIFGIHYMYLPYTFNFGFDDLSYC